jgi:excisionase family DNA binding protein
MMAGNYAPIKEVAEYFKVSVSTLRTWVRTGKIPASTYIKIDGTYRFNLNLVEEALLEASEPKKASAPNRFDVSVYNKVEENDK